LLPRARHGAAPPPPPPSRERSQQDDEIQGFWSGLACIKALHPTYQWSVFCMIVSTIGQIMTRAKQNESQTVRQGGWAHLAAVP
jgi:hypothetical protein